MAEELLALMHQLGPDLMQELALRALMMERIASLEPVGRRQLAAHLDLPEREIRTIAAFLREADLLCIDAAGMSLSVKGQLALPRVRAFSRALRGLMPAENVADKKTAGPRKPHR